ncbi:RICIN domain-containing protein [Nonomuraea sp. NPDC050394]|uniref:RICIN domain-containing protein n=1 Tax=Nonomuraea sp. NPDC050394 TaxID=3364363 RepID=UPI0037B4BD7C
MFGVERGAFDAGSTHPTGEIMRLPRIVAAQQAPVPARDVRSRGFRLAATATLAVPLLALSAAPGFAQASARTDAAGTAAGSAANGWIRITNAFDRSIPPNQCLDADVEGGGGNGNRVIVWQCNGNSPQQWWRWHANGWLENQRYRGMCLDADRHGSGNGIRVMLWRCADVAWHKWLRGSDPRDRAIYNVYHYNGGDTVLDRDANVPGNGAQVQLWRKNGQSQQFWDTY